VRIPQPWQPERPTAAELLASAAFSQDRYAQAFRSFPSERMGARFGLNDFEKAYDVFANSAASGALKVMLTRSEGKEDR
jgi:hypothetical protein